jgi:hypothetical protein
LVNTNPDGINYWINSKKNDDKKSWNHRTIRIEFFKKSARFTTGCNLGGLLNRHLAPPEFGNLEPKGGQGIILYPPKEKLY